MKYFLPVLLIVSALPLRAQEVSAADSTEIQQRALRNVRQFESLLNLIAQPDEYFKASSLEELIRGYYDEQSNYQIFRDSLVAVENDLLPASQAIRSSSLTIKDYLQRFFSSYEKSPVASVFFSNYEVSSVQPGEVPYVEVTYDVRFNNRHQSYPDQAYPVRRRKAIVSAYQESGSWQLLITNLATASTSDTSTASNIFAGLQSVYRSGKTYPIPIRQEAVRLPSSLVLYHGGEPVEDLSGLVASEDSLWRISDRVKVGRNYQLRLYDPLTGRVAESDTFAVKRRPLWPFVVVGAGAVGIFYLIKSISSEGESNGSNAFSSPSGK